MRSAHESTRRSRTSAHKDGARRRRRAARHGSTPAGGCAARCEGVPAFVSVPGDPRRPSQRRRPMHGAALAAALGRVAHPARARAHSAEVCGESGARCGVVAGEEDGGSGSPGMAWRWPGMEDGELSADES